MIHEVRSSLGVAIDDCPVRDNWVVEICEYRNHVP
jgi:hypothetical protein